MVEEYNKFKIKYRESEPSIDEVEQNLVNSKSQTLYGSPKTKDTKKIPEEQIN